MRLDALAEAFLLPARGGLGVDPRFNIVAIKVYEERAVVSAPPNAWTPIVHGSALQAYGVKSVDRVT